MRFSFIAVAAIALLTQVTPWAAETKTGPVKEVRPSGSVWVVESAEGGRLFLCGTIHILREEDYPLAPAYEAAYAESQRLVFELPPGASSGGAFFAKVQEVGLLPAGETLEKHIDAEMWKGVVSWAKMRGVGLEQVERYRPWFAALIIAAVEYGALGAEPEKGVDNYFEARAKKDGKPGAGLETVDFQLGLFSKLGAEQQVDLLRQTLVEVKSVPEEFKKLIAAWKDGDLESLRVMLYREAEQYPELMDLFLHDRNLRWLGELEGFLKKGERVMVLVGTGHFAGKLGLIELLRARGYKVERYLSGQGG